MKINIDPVYDQAILTALREGRHRRAARILVRNYGRAVFNLCLAMVEDTEQAEDLTQASFQRALSSMSDLQRHGTTLKWLEATTRECCEAHGLGQAEASRELSEGSRARPPRGISDSLERRLDVLAACL